MGGGRVIFPLARSWEAQKTMRAISSREVAQIRQELANLIEKLKINKQNVSLDILKTRYKKSYESLCNEIKSKSENYFVAYVLSAIKVEREYIDEAVSIINDATLNSDIEKQLSKTVFSHQDIEEFDTLVGDFVDQLGDDLEAFYARYSNKYPTDDPNVWVIYSKVNNSIKVCGRWFPLNIFTKGGLK